MSPDFPKQKEKLSTLIDAEPLSSLTEEKRRNLLYAASAAILLSVYQLKINKTPWLDIEVPQGAPGILSGALSVALLYTLLVFLLHTWTDIHRWYLARDFIRIDGYSEFFVRMHNHLNGIEHTINSELQRNSTDEEQKKQQFMSTLSTGLSVLDSISAEYKTLRRSHRTLTLVQLLRLILLDVGGPLALGFFAFCKISPAFYPFISAIF
jgi:hypothetical protein